MTAVETSTSLWDLISVLVVDAHGEQLWTCTARHHLDWIDGAETLIALTERLQKIETDFNGIQMVCQISAANNWPQPHTIESLLWILCRIVYILSASPNVSFAPSVTLTRTEVILEIREHVLWFQKQGYFPQQFHVYRDSPFIN